MVRRSQKLRLQGFKKSVLIRSIEEINMKIDDMDLELFQAKRGRQVVQVEIHNNFARRSSTKDL